MTDGRFTKMRNPLVPPPNQLCEQAARTLQAFRELAATPRQRTFRAETSAVGSERPLDLPRPILALLIQVLEPLAAGQAIDVVAVPTLLTTQEAADLLKRSRTHVVRLLTEGQIAFHKVGTHRRIRLDDLRAYQSAAPAKLKPKP